MRHPGWARRTRCSRRRTAAPSGAPTSWSGYVETHGRRHTAALLDGLEVVPRQTVRYRGSDFEELDVDAVLERHPRVAVIDELAHTNVPASRNAKRWQDVRDLLDAGIDVLSTVNVQHLESLNDVVGRITGTAQRETVPDRVVRAAEQVELVDMTPEALRRRMAHGNIYAPEKVDAALGNYFRAGNLTALRELALLWLADKVDDQLDSYRAEHSIDDTWETRERVVVALTGGPEGDTLIRRAARIAARTRGADLMAVHVARSDGLAGADPANLARQRVLAESLGGTYHEVIGADIPEALLDVRPRRQRHPDRAGREPARSRRADVVAGRRRHHHRPLRRDRRPSGRARTRRRGPALGRAPSGVVAPPPGFRLDAHRGGTADADARPAARSPACR